MPFISVILPLRLDWQPVYRTASGIPPGTVLEVPFGRKKYLGVVEAEVGAPQEVGRVLEAGEISPLWQFSPETLDLWRFIAGYYMCTIGEVFKAALPASRRKEAAAAMRRTEAARLREKKRSEALEAKVSALRVRISLKEQALADCSGRAVKRKAALEDQIRSLLSDLEKLQTATVSQMSLDIPQTPPVSAAEMDLAASLMSVTSKPAVLFDYNAERRLKVYSAVISRIFETGKSVLLLMPDDKSASDALRLLDGHRNLTAGTRNSLLAPPAGLGAIIIDSEESRSYKQYTPAPRFNARDCAAVLGRLLGCPVIFGSGTPSCETLYNCSCGKYAMVRAPRSRMADVSIVDISAEKMKRGVSGSFTFKAIAAIQKELGQGKNPVVFTSKYSDIQKLTAEISLLFPSAVPIVSALSDIPDGTSLIVLPDADRLFPGLDFRSDERAAVLFWKLRYMAGRHEGGHMLIQTGKSTHPVFMALEKGTYEELMPSILKERLEFGYPPYKRLVHISVRGNDAAGAEILANAIARKLSGTVSQAEVSGPEPSYLPQDSGDAAFRIRITFDRSVSPAPVKKEIAGILGGLVPDRGRLSVTIDADPV